MPEHLLESEFFGYEEGAFTGVVQKGKLGKF
nr:sigma 54-interacting transcriptional regulator [Alteribacillus bidgolensis]